MSLNFHRFVILYLSCDTRSVGLGQYCLPKVSNGLKRTHRPSVIIIVIYVVLYLLRPAVRKMTKTSEFKQAVKDHKAFFLLVTAEQNPESDLSVSPGGFLVCYQ